MRKPTAASLHDVIDRALPKRDPFENRGAKVVTTIPRKALIGALVERVEQWNNFRPEATREAERIRQRVAISDSLAAAVGKALAKLTKLDPHPDQLDRRLYLRCEAVLDELRRWDHFNRPGRRRPPAGSATLTRQVLDLCRRQAGCTADEADLVLQAISVNIVVTLSSATLRKRAERSKRRATK